MQSQFPNIAPVNPASFLLFSSSKNSPIGIFLIVHDEQDYILSAFHVSH